LFCHFTVKRKHITQNRDIIKTNALAQLRIKELEEKVLQLEGERAEKNLEIIRIRANMDRVERATKQVMRGWQFVGAGLTAMAAVDGFQCAQPSELVEIQMRDNHRSDAVQQRPSSRIVLDPHALPGGVSRSVARAPEVLLGDLVEEESRELERDETEEGVETVVEADDTEMAEEEGETSNVSFNNEETIRVESQSKEAEKSFGERRHWTAHVSQEAETSFGGAEGSYSVSEASTSSIYPSSNHLLRVDQGDTRLHRATSIDSLSSFADDEEVQLSDDIDEEGEEDILSSLLQESKRMAEEEDETYPGKSRKKRFPPVTSERPSEGRSSTPSRLSGNHSSSENDSPQVVRSSRRSSARNGKSINYALPKLNTKMRKPDPSDLIPAIDGEARHRDSDAGSVGDSSREATPKRALKGKNEAASTGNLREIRKQHQSARKGQDDEEGQPAKWDQSPNTSVNGRQGPMTRRRSSTGPQPKKSSPGEGRSSDREDQDRSNLRDVETIGAGMDTSNWSNSTDLPPTWKSSPLIGSNSSSSSSKSAANGTPIPRSNSGQHIKALKVANRIQKGNVNQPVFPTDNSKRVNGRPVPASNGKVLGSSIKVNLSKPTAPSSNGELKRSSLHAAMTLEDEDKRMPPTYSGER